MTDRPTLTATGLVRRYGRDAGVHGVDLTLVPGQVTALLGPSGSGKSTLLRLIAGLEAPDAGEIRLGETELSRSGHAVPPEHRGIGLMFQEHALFPHKTVLGNVTFGLNHLPRAEANARALDLLRSLRLEDRAKAWPSTLSGGEQQRVALARALAREPAVLLMDEPFSGLDASLRAEVRDALTPALRAAGAAVLIVTHDAEDALAMADHLILLDQGTVLQAGTPEACYLRPVSLAAARMLGPVEALPARADGETVVTPLGRFALPDREATDWQLLVRPGDVRLADQGVPATVVARRFAGHATDVTVAMAGPDGDHRLTVSHTGPAPAQGQPVSLVLDADRAVVVAA
ncbi:MAG: ABC transporter ATP-binding protein [Brevundimonas sp.]|uniref:ABC transporter ATP-binding protein n=1 Tax=Brevundimonas sp. TaxID=1871086 RepID=UPI002ABB2E8F|nr:ABC transporter ATP-binding protein [Brevundimonas sp.]MDZ4113638.1 ABC transporter ATP-binding protein [Brevundimonas sp.]